MQTPKNILVATDFGELGQHAVELAFAMAEKLAGKVHIVNVVIPRESDETAGRGVEELVRAEQSARRRMHELAETVRSTGRLGETRIGSGNAATIILLTAEELEADLIVTGTHGRSGFSRIVLGSTAETVLRKASCPVLLAKKVAVKAKHEPLPSSPAALDHPVP